MSPRPADVAVGTELPEQTFQVTRADLIRYAGASGDFNVIHWNDRVAREVGLPGVIAHGMLTAGLAVRAVTTWTGDPGAVVDYLLYILFEMMVGTMRVVNNPWVFFGVSGAVVAYLLYMMIRKRKGERAGVVDREPEL